MKDDVWYETVHSSCGWTLVVPMQESLNSLLVWNELLEVFLA